MLETVDVGTQELNLYERSAGAEAVSQLRQLAAPLEGARIVHVNATLYGGGVAKILRSEIPLLRNLGLLADWKLITGDQTFFMVTKAIHNGLQGAPRELTPAEQETYLTHSTRSARLLEEEYDLVVVHDPQPLALLKLHGKGTSRWVWRCHIDTSEPNLQVWNFLRPYLEGYDATVFTLGSFARRPSPPSLTANRPSACSTSWSWRTSSMYSSPATTSSTGSPTPRCTSLRRVSSTSRRESAWRSKTPRRGCRGRWRPGWRSSPLRPGSPARSFATPTSWIAAASWTTLARCQRLCIA